jgi:hypothetical protein
MECRKIIWSCINPKLKSLTSKDYGKRDLFRLGLLEKVSKRLEAERTLDKVKTYNKKARCDKDKSSFFGQGCFSSVWELEDCTANPLTHLIYKVSKQQVHVLHQRPNTLVHRFKRQIKVTPEQVDTCATSLREQIT